MSSRIGGMRRASFSSTVSRPLTRRLAASLGLSAQRAAEGAPFLPGFGSIAWAPEYYVEPNARVAWTGAPRRGLTAGASAQAGYAFVRERAVDRRFVAGSTPTGGLAADMRWIAGAWEVGAGAGIGGALGTGYRAGNLSVLGAYRPGSR